MPTYKELEIMSFAEAGFLHRAPVGPSAYLTGHHIIPDHCFYICKGGRSAQGVKNMRVMGVGAYNTLNAPVILLTSDVGGGKALHHGEVHANFDPVEKNTALTNIAWSYGDVKDLAIRSILDVFGGTITADTIEAQLDAYFITQLGMKNSSMIRCGEHSSLAGSELAFPTWKSPRAKFKPY